MLRHIPRTAVLAGGILATMMAPVVTRVLHAQMKCYFKDCIVFEDGSRLCQVKEVPCPTET
jgi:hypothetical protein